MEVACSNHAGDIMKCKWYGCNRVLREKTPTGRIPTANFCSQRCANKSAIDKARRRAKRMAVDYLGGKCDTCGYSTCIAALEFRHTDPNAKTFGLAVSNLVTRSWDKVKEELDKCQLLCANCRREVEYLEHQNRYLEH